jgi:hypothetical protein
MITMLSSQTPQTSYVVKPLAKVENVKLSDALGSSAQFE